MSHLIQELESRTLLTASATTLAADSAAINAAAIAIKADLKLLSTGAKADALLIGKDIKTTKTSAPLLRKLQGDEAKFITKLTADVTALQKATALVKSSVSDGNKSIATPTKIALSEKIGVDVAALAVVTTKPQAKLIADSATTAVDADFDSLAPTSAHATSGKAHFDSLTAKVISDANAYVKAIGRFHDDLTTLLPVPTITPSLVGDYQGTFKTKAIAFGLGSIGVPFEINITSQTLTSVQGSISAEGNTASGNIAVTELSNGKVTLKLSNSSLVVNLLGVVNVNTTKTGLPPGSAITGSGSVSVLGFQVSGTFQVIKVT